MANAVTEGIKDAGGEAVLLTPTSFSKEMADGFDALAFGCPLMGAEQLEEGEFEPMCNAVEPALKGKKIALFGPYGWGDGEWVREWEKTCLAAGAVLACDSVICNEAPDNDAVDSCKALGRSLVTASIVFLIFSAHMGRIFLCLKAWV